MPAAATVTTAEISAAGHALITVGKGVTGGGLRAQIGRGDPRRLMNIWEQLEPPPSVPADDAAQPVVNLPPALAEQETGSLAKLATELSTAISGAWVLAERLAAERLGAEVAAARAAAAGVQGELDQMAEILAAADAARETAEIEAERANAGEAEARKAADLAAHAREVADADRSRLLMSWSKLAQMPMRPLSGPLWPKPPGRAPLRLPNWHGRKVPPHAKLPRRSAVKLPQRLPQRQPQRQRRKSMPGAWRRLQQRRGRQR